MSLVTSRGLPDKDIGSTIRNVSRSKCFAAVARRDARVLILGSLPGCVSLERGEYYAHPRNAFWDIMGNLFGASRDLPYALRLHRLKERGIALWDVCASGRRAGSLDGAIADEVTHDLDPFLKRHTCIKLICFNGSMAGRIFERRVLARAGARMDGIRREVLASTSPAHAAMTFEQKLKRWREVLESVVETR